MTIAAHSPNYSSCASFRGGRERLVIGLVNNMPDPALQTTERQFRELLQAAGVDYDIRLRLFSFPELIRGEGGKAYIASHYEPVDHLWTGDLDGLIVTGAEPRTPALSDEVYWRSLTRLVEWANDREVPTVWSCLAAHGAVLHLDGIARRRLGEKISGVFSCAKSSAHPLMTGLPSSWRIPHSRLNTLDAERLVEHGYEVLSFSEDAGPDTFLLQRRAPFVFFQGHPEYDADTLFREYRRDVGRFLTGLMNCYPEMPRGYFDDVATRALMTFRARAQRQPSRELLEEFPGGDGRERPAHAWHDVAIRIYANWLRHFVASHEPESSSTVDGAVPADVG